MINETSILAKLLLFRDIRQAQKNVATKRGGKMLVLNLADKKGMIDVVVGALSLIAKHIESEEFVSIM